MSTPTGAFGTAPEPAKPEIDVLSAVLPASAEPEPSFGKVLSDSGSSSGGNNAKLRGNTLDSPPEPEPKRDGGRGNSSEENCDGFFNVLSADKSKALSIPAELIEPTIGSKNYVSRNRSTKVPSYALYLCKSFSTSGNCAHGSRCDFIHSRHDLVETCGSNSRVSVIQVHWSTPVCSLEDALYERHEPGFIFYINQGHSGRGGPTNPLQLQSEYVYRTKGSEEARHSDSTKFLRFCKHYEREKCGRGNMCNFIHRVNFNTRLAHMSLQGHSIRQHRHQYNAMYRGGYGGAYHHHHTQQLHQMPQPHVHGSGSSAHGHHMGGQPYQSHGTYRQQRQQLALPQGGGDYMFNSLPVHQQHAAGPIPFGGCGPMPSRGGVVVPPGPPLKHHHGSAHHHHHHHHQQTMPPPRVLSPSQGHSFDPVFTSRPTSYTNNPPPEMSVMPLSGSSSYFTQQQNPEPAQLATSDVPRQTVGQRASASDYVVSSLLVTYM